MSSAMALDTPKPKLELDEFTAAAISATPPELHPYFESFRTLHRRKYVIMGL
jgi:26S proteasome regulatory subunit N9